jgi:hypothetical protein
MQQQKKAEKLGDALASLGHSRGSGTDGVLPIVRKSRGVAYGIQQGYANWQCGLGLARAQRLKVVAED